MKRIMFDVTKDDRYELKHITTKVLETKIYKCHGNEVLQINTDEEYLIVNTDREFYHEGGLAKNAREWARLLVGYYLTGDMMLIIVTDKKVEAWPESKEQREIRLRRG